MATSHLRTARARARHAKPAQLPRAIGLAGLATVTTVAFLPGGSAVAEPAPSVSEVAQRVGALDIEADVAVEEFRQAEQQLAEVERRLAVATDQAAREQARLAEVRQGMSDLVAAAYRRGGNDRFLSLIKDSDPQTFLQRASSLDRVASSQADVLAEVATARHRLDGVQASAAREVEAERTAARELAERRSQIESTLRAQQALLDGLQAEERRRVEAAREAAEAAVVAPAPAVVAPAPARASRDGRSAPAAPGASAAAAASDAAAAATPTFSGPASGRASVAVQEAYAQLGKPYRWGGNGPENFDCSGFTSWVWREAGVSLPRTSRAQYADGRKVSRSDVQPGDLVYFGNPIHHVGVYVGDGNMISATRTGQPVKMQPAFRGDYVGATRP